MKVLCQLCAIQCSNQDHYLPYSIYDVDSQWKSLAQSYGISIDDDTNTRIIINDIMCHGKDLATLLRYMECQLCMCMAYQLSLSLKKSFIFPKRFEFVGNNVTPKGYRPAQSKHELLHTWPQPEIIRDVAKIIGFSQFYSKYIPHFELRVSSLWKLTTTREYTDPVADLWTEECQHAFDDIRDAIISDPCMLRFNHRCLIVLRTDFSAKGFGYVVC